MKIAIAQIKCDPGILAENQKKIISYITKAKKQNVELLIFPELTIPSYAHLDLVRIDEYIDENLKCLNKLAKECTDIACIVGFIDVDKKLKTPEGKRVLYNSAAFLENGSIKAIQHKSLLPNYDIFFEKRYFSEGNKSNIIEFKGKKIGLGICEDLFDEGYQEKVYPELLNQGAEVLVNISASPFWQGKFEERLLAVRKILNNQNAQFIFANLVGSYDMYEGEVVFDGRSFFTDSKGEIECIAEAFIENLLVYDIAEDKSELKVEIDEIADVTEAILLGISDYYRRLGFKRALIGLSGGIDSSLVAALAVKALGSENVIGITMPSHITSKETKSDAFLLAENLGIKIHERPIVNEYNAWLESFQKVNQSKPKSLTKQNKQARIRGSILMEYANEDRQAIVLSTGNKTELGLGYCTIYGDMVGGFAPISDLPKTLVYQVSEYLNKKEGKELIPVSVINRVPTAELEEGQIDSDNLPADYAELDPIFIDLVEKEQSVAELSKKYDVEVLEKTARLIRISEFKRRQASPGIKVRKKSFGIGRRYPMY